MAIKHPLSNTCRFDLLSICCVIDVSGLNCFYMLLCMWQTSVIPSVEDLDPDVLSTLTSLQCFKDKDKLISDLLSVR